MEVNEQLVRAVTQAVVAQLMASGAQPQNVSSTPAPEGAGSLPARQECVRNILMKMPSEHRRNRSEGDRDRCRSSIPD